MACKQQRLIPFAPAALDVVRSGLSIYNVLVLFYPCQPDGKTTNPCPARRSTPGFPMRKRAREAPAFSAAQKRKRQTKMLQGQKVEDAVSPSTTLAELELESGEKIALKACVFGTIIELNKNLTPEVLNDDPLLNGFLAIILPSGSFPPRERQDQGAKESSHQSQSKTKENVTVDNEA